MPKINSEEYQVLTNLDPRWEWLARDVYLYAYENRPVKQDNGLWVDEFNRDIWKSMDNDLFQFVKWGDEEPYSIQDLIYEYEQNFKSKKLSLRQSVEHLETYKFGKYDKYHDKLKDVTSYVKKSEVLNEIDKLDETEQKYYAKIKGWELHYNNHNYWNLETNPSTNKKSLCISSNNSNYSRFETKFTKEEWANLGINDTNADFEEVE